ncbi:MAG: hypothetical protein KF881_09265 [Acidobacteria bacterium]|nr:hypothetical protein [Acidobacteriota bacterium]
MKLKALFVIGAILALSIGIAAYAFNIGGESCPIKSMMVSAEGKPAHDCCKGDKESCPMKNGEGHKMNHADYKKADGEGHKMSGENCPMKKKMDAAATESMQGDKGSCPMKNGKGDKMAAGGEKCCDCCDNCTGCGHCGKEKKEADTAV